MRLNNRGNHFCIDVLDDNVGDYHAAGDFLARLFRARNARHADGVDSART